MGTQGTGKNSVELRLVFSKTDSWSTSVDGDVQNDDVGKTLLGWVVVFTTNNVTQFALSIREANHEGTYQAVVHTGAALVSISSGLNLGVGSFATDGTYVIFLSEGTTGAPAPFLLRRPWRVRAVPTGTGVDQCIVYAMLLSEFA